MLTDEINTENQTQNDQYSRKNVPQNTEDHSYPPLVHALLNSLLVKNLTQDEMF